MTRPCLTVSWTWGRRTTDVRTPRAASEAAVASEARGVRGADWNRRIVLSSGAALCQKRKAGGNDQEAIGAGQRGTESFDGALVNLAVFLEFREVVDEAQVDDAVRSRCSAAQAIEILERPAMYLSSFRSKGLGARI